MSMSDLVGQQVQGYQLTLELDHTASHTLYLGEPVEGGFPKHYIVCKHWHGRILSSEEQERFRAEAQRLQCLKHPHMLPIRTYGIEDECAYVISDYAPKKSLRTLLLRKNPLLVPLPDALTIISQIGLALTAAHRQGVIHGNLKPENVLFSANGEVVVTDFWWRSLEGRGGDDGGLGGGMVSGEILSPAANDHEGPSPNSAASPATDALKGPHHHQDPAPVPTVPRPV